MKEFSNRDKLKAFISTKVTDSIIFLDNDVKLDLYTEGNIYGIYCYLEIIGYLTTLTTSGQRSQYFGPSSSTNNYKATTQPVIEAIRVQKNWIYEFCGRIGNKDDTCIISDPKLLPPSLKINMNQFNSLHGDEPTDPPRECNSHPPAYHFKYNTSLLKTSPVVSAITGRLNQHAIDNGDV